MRCANALCNPLPFIVTGDERHDCTQAQALLDGFHAHAVLADKGDVANVLVTWIPDRGLGGDPTEIEPDHPPRLRQRAVQGAQSVGMDG